MRKLMIELWFSEESVGTSEQAEDILASCERALDKAGYAVNVIEWKESIKPEEVETVDTESISKVKGLIDSVFADDEERWDPRTCSGHLWREVKTAQDIERCVRDYLKDFCSERMMCDCDFYDALYKAFPEKKDMLDEIIEFNEEEGR